MGIGLSVLGLGLVSLMLWSVDLYRKRKHDQHEIEHNRKVARDWERRNAKGE